MAPSRATFFVVEWCKAKQKGGRPPAEQQMKRILVVDDEPNIVELISFNLEKEGYEVARAFDGEEAWRLLREESFDMILLDIMMPGLDGMSLCRRIRERQDTPIMMISAKIEEFDKVLALELGADDYMTKPFSVRELVARVKAILRRSQEAAGPGDGDRIAYGELVLLPAEHKFQKGGRDVALTLTEYQIMELLMRNPGKVLSREILTEY